jgi:hypothetical protein
MSFREAFIRGRAEMRARARAGRDAPPRWPPEPPPYAPPDDMRDPREDGEPVDGQPSADVAALQAALQERDAELAANRELVVELKEYAEQLQTRMAELIAGTEPMAKTLLLPGVRPFLLNRFHPDKHPDADEEQKALLTEALQIINAAYAGAEELQTPSE